MSLALELELSPSGPRRFLLVRDVDVSEVSGTGIIAEGMQCTDGTAVLHWYGKYPTTTVFPSIEAILEIHGHGGLTNIHWLDLDRILERLIP